MQDTGYIDLNRRFARIPDDSIGEERLRELEVLAYLSDESSDLDWDVILKERRIVVLGEPGSGKTEEFKHQSASLHAAGEYAFLIDLRDLVNDRLSEVFDRKGELKKFRNWLASDKPAWFFLDAVDESRLAHPKDFQTALENFARDLETRVRLRAHVLLSSRISSWRPKEDLRLLESQLAFDKPADSEAIDSPTPKSPYGDIEAVETHVSEPSDGDHGQLLRASVVAITPLHLGQIETFVDHLGGNGKKFCQDLVAKFLEPLSRRPLDVEKLYRYWQDKNGFGAYIDMLGYSVSHGLEEPSKNAARDVLTPEKAQLGAETLAAMVLFCRRRNISLPGMISESLEPRVALPAKWADSDVSSLLDRALFDAPLFGRVRFHHRETEEYLTACWLRRLMNRNLPEHVLKRLLFEELSDGQLVLRSAMAPVAAWFACFNIEEAKQVRGWLRKAEPELFFRAGDPSQLSLEYRESILGAIIESYDGWEFTRIDIDRAALTRLAHPGLVDFLASKCIDKTIPDDLRRKLFYMADFGRLSGLEKSAITVILDNDESNYIKTSACDYLVRINDAASLTTLAGSLAAIKSPSDSLVASFLTALFPGFISSSDATLLLKRLGRIEEFSHSLQYALVRHCKENCTPDESIQFLDVMCDVLSDGPPWYREGKGKYHVGSRFIGLGDVLLELLPGALSKPDLTKNQISVLARSAWLIGYLSRYGRIHYLDRFDLKALFATHESVRRRYLSFSLEMYRQAHGSVGGGEWFFISSTSAPILQHQDATWILDDAKNSQEDVTTLLLQIVESLWHEAGYPREVRSKARNLIRRKVFDEKRRIPQFPGQFLRLWHSWRGKYRQTLGNRYWWSQRGRAARSKLQWWRNQCALLKLLPSIRNGGHTGALWFLVNELSEKDSSHLARTGWKEMRENRGRWITAAAKRGVIAFWPEFRPKLKHERSDGNISIDVGVIIGLTGIQEAIIADQLDFSSISEDQARQLTRYALNEINGFPTWFKQLAAAQSSAVRDVVMSAIEHEWQLKPEIEHVHDVLASLSYDQTGVYAFFRTPVLKKLQNSDPSHPAVTSQVLRLLFRDVDKSSDTLCGLAANRVSEYSIGTLQHMEWMKIWLQFDAASALNLLEELLSKMLDPNDYMIRLGSALSSDGRFDQPVVAKPSFRDPDHAHRLITLFFKFVPPKLDPSRPSGKAHSVTSLDEAVRFRDGLIAHLGEIDDDNAGHVLESLLIDPVLYSHYDWIRHLVLMRRRRKGEMEPWTEAQIRIFEEKHETAPLNPRQLFQLTCDRLQDIKDWVESGEDSPRGELHPGNVENDVRVWVARKLKDRSRGLFSVPEEQELASGKRQDIRIVAPEVAGPIVIELKQKEGWSYAKLRERLKNQLVGDYLKAQNARFGIYLVSFTGHSGKGSGGIDPLTGKKLNFPEIVENLEILARELVAENAGVENLKVIGIDFVNA